MSTHDIQSYINHSREQGLTDLAIQESLTKVGWTPEQLQPYFTSVTQLIPPVPPATAKGSTTMWDAFQHIILFIALYVYTSSFGTLVHIFIDKWLPKVPNNYDYYMSDVYDYIIRMAAAALMVSFPIFAYLFITLNQKTLKNPALRSISSRKKLIYFTLVITFIIGIFEIGRTIFSFLGGNVSLNFLAHFALTLSIVSAIFFYYLNEVKEDRKYL